MRIPTQQQVKQWLIEQRELHDYVYEDFAREVGRNVQTVRGWMQETNTKQMPESALIAAGRVMRDHARAESSISRTMGDLTPDEWKRAAEIAQDQGLFLQEFLTVILRERLETEASIAKLNDDNIELSASPRILKMAAKIKDREARETDDEYAAAELRGYAKALRDVAKSV